jgi:hypothetical protein
MPGATSKAVISACLLLVSHYDLAEPDVDSSSCSLDLFAFVYINQCINVYIMLSPKDQFDQQGLGSKIENCFWHHWNHVLSNSKMYILVR